MKIFIGIHRIQVSAFILSILIALPIYAQRMQNTADYFIAEHTDQLLIYNKYQQRISKKESVLFAPFVPIRILESKSMLNDNYTICTKIELDGNEYFLIKNDKNILIQNAELGFTKVYKNTIIIQDTIQLTAERNIEILSADQKQKYILQNRDILIRYFKADNLTYVKISGKQSKFGWIDFTKDVEYISLRAKERSVLLNHALSKQTLSRINTRIEEANILLVKLFLYFNEHSLTMRETPYWKSVKSNDKIIYIMEPNYYIKYYQNSSQYLSRDLENILLGTNYIVSYTPGKIEIQQK